jgi:hypothetical protein
MADTPTCRDCSLPMIAAKGYHAILALEPPDDLDFEQFSPISLYLCGQCGQIRMYAARREALARQNMEAVSYGYRITGEEREPAPADDGGQEADDVEHEPRRSRA